MINLVRMFKVRWCSEKVATVPQSELHDILTNADRKPVFDVVEVTPKEVSNGS